MFIAKLLAKPPRCSSLDGVSLQSLEHCCEKPWEQNCSGRGGARAVLEQPRCCLSCREQGNRAKPFRLKPRLGSCYGMQLVSMSEALLDEKPQHPQAEQGDSHLTAPKMRLSYLLLHAHVKARPRRHLLLLSTRTGCVPASCNALLSLSGCRLQPLSLRWDADPDFPPLGTVVSSVDSLL